MIYRSLVLVALPVLAGCYVYRPVPVTTPPIGSEVRLTLTDLGTANLAAQVGPSTEALAGRLVGDSAESYLVSLLGTRQRSGIEIGWRGERVSVPRPLVARVEERRFSRKRTVFMTVGLVAGAFLAREAFWGPGGFWGSAGPGRGPVPQ